MGESLIGTVVTDDQVVVIGIGSVADSFGVLLAFPPLSEVYPTS